jgi:hypothetical protein
MTCSSVYRLFFISAPSLRLRENSSFNWLSFSGAGHTSLNNAKEILDLRSVAQFLRDEPVAMTCHANRWHME